MKKCQFKERSTTTIHTNSNVKLTILLSVRIYNLTQGCHLSGKPRNVRQFRNFKNVRKKLGN